MTMRDDQPVSQVALWRLTKRNAPRYDLYATEQEAADHAAAMDSLGDECVLGVQFPDGRTIEIDEWGAFAAAVRRLRGAREWLDAGEPATPRPAPRASRDPFQGRPLDIDASEPTWLGSQS